MEVSIIIPAYNEEVLLGQTLNTVAQAISTCGFEADTEVIVVDNNSTDDTAKVAAQSGAVVVFEGVNQISRARNSGAKVARGKYLIFLDADTTLSAALLERAIANLRAGDCCGGGVMLEMEKPMPFLIQSTVDVWNRFAASAGLAAGCFVYCTKQGFEAIGGFSEKVYAGEEIWFSRHLKKWGKRPGLRFKVITDIRISTSSRKVDWYTPFQLTTRVVWIMLFPWLTRSKKFCLLWYERPSEQ